jgi:hypothetical protein
MQSVRRLRYAAQMPRPPPIQPKVKLETHGTSVRLPLELIDRLDRYAAQQSATRSEALVHLLRWALDKAES